MHAPTDNNTLSPPPVILPSISLVLPAWNESEVILTAINEADEALRKITDRFEIIVVDDGSTDTTASIVEQVSRTNPSVRLMRHSPNQGYGAALRSGFAAAVNDLVAFTDADCQFDLSELDRFVLLSRRYDIVCGYRIDRKDTALRCLYSKVYNQLVRAFLRTGVRDVDCALKMFHRDVVQNLSISGNGFLVNSELLVQANQQGRSVVEVGVSHRPRTQGSSTVSIRHIPKVLTALARYWWNTVQFPTTASAESPGTQISGPPQRMFGYLQIALLCVAAIFLLTNLGYPLIDRDETRYAEIPREMIATGNWVLPQLNFETYYDKPPLLYWLCAISFTLFGTHEATARVVPACAALTTITATMFFGSRFFDRKIGLLSGVVLMLSIGFAFTSRYLLLDGVLAMFVTLSLFTAYEAIRASDDRQRLHLGWWLLSGICCGLGFLTKGPVAIVLWLPPLFAFAWLSDSVIRPRWWHYAFFGGTVAAIVGPWMIAVTAQDPTFLVEFFYRHNLARFAGEFHAKPFWYFVPVLLIAGHPWSFLTIPYAKFLIGNDEATRRHRSPVIGFLFLWSVWCFVFFSLSRCKLPTYLLPASPAMAVMLAHYLSQVLRDPTNANNLWFARFWSARSATATTCLAGVGFVVFVMYQTGETALSISLWAVVWTALLVSSLLLLADRHHAKTAWVSSTAAAFLFAIMVMHQLLPAYSRSQSLFADTSPLQQRLAVETPSAIATVSHEFSEVPFYLDRDNIPNFAAIDDGKLTDFVTKNENCILVVNDRVASNQLRQFLPTNSQLTDLGRRGPARVYEVHLRSPDARLARTQTPQSQATHQ
ncbi:glycosyltransferase [Aporhodopirellula aestuarii]|uniref:Glycosyltransferase n=1 Tax=Aporhodopirellula aestuarii TaxID=2950107 RepID=A0ABT0U834_9BACT|nr:glycosyltransferase [Aporhodopirellula aestuarii]MCM2372578.1 glycosyltransferase [Aporhodopirellula aestuarii]